MCVNNGTTMDTVQIQQWRTGVRKLVTDVKVCIIARFFFLIFFLRFKNLFNFVLSLVNLTIISKRGDWKQTFTNSYEWTSMIRSRQLSISCYYSYFIQGRPGLLGIQYIGVSNFRYTVFLCLKLGIEYSLMTNFGYKVYRVFFFLINFGILHEF